MPETLPKTMLDLIRLTRRGYLKFGDQGEDVAAAQKVLAVLGYALTGTGYFGTASELAVKDLQAKGGLDDDGELGEQTAMAIDRMLTAGEVVAIGKPVPAGGPPPATAPIASRDPLWVIAALRMIGVNERAGAGNNPEILAWARDEDGMIAETYRADSVAWCALAANHVLTVAGLKGTETLWALDWNSDRWPNVKLAGPARGAFAPMKRNGGGHIAIVMGRDQAGHLMMWGGNQSDGTNIKPFPRERPLSFRWPKATGIPLPAATGFDHLPLIKSDGRVSTKEA